MQPGTLRKRVGVQQLVTARLANGEQTDSWTTIVTRWGSMKYRTGKETPTSNIQIQGQAFWEVILRNESALRGLSIEWKLIIDGRLFRILSSEDVGGLGQMLRIYCVEDV